MSNAIIFANLKKEGRLEAIDLLKLFAALLVIFSHCMNKYIDASTYNPIYNFIWLTQMPLFMFLSGFVNINCQKVNTTKKYLFKILKSSLYLLVPCISFGLIKCILDNISPLSAIKQFFYDPSTNLWFLWVLFVIHVIFDFGLFISSKFKFHLKSLVALIPPLMTSLILIVLKFSLADSIDLKILALKLVAYYIPFYCLGYIFHLFVNSSLLENKATKILSFVALGLFLIVLTFECFYYSSIYSFDDSSIKFLLIRMIGSVSSIFLCVFVANILVNCKPIIYISKFGAFSLQSYYLHILFMRIFDFQIEGQAAQWIIAFLIGVVLVLIVVLTLLIIYYIPFLHFILFGKSFSKYQFEKQLINKAKIASIQ